MLERLRDRQENGCAFVVIVGASGAGKSSLARAGVAASLTQYAADTSVRAWHAAVLIPGLIAAAERDGECERAEEAPAESHIDPTAVDLCRGLVGTLAESLPELADGAVGDIAEGLARDAALTVRLSVAPAFERAAERAGGTVRLLLVLDQLEEL